MAEIAILHGAESDFLRIYADCEDRRSGGGEFFNAEFERVLRLLAQFPRSGRIIEPPYRRMPLSRVGYSAIYSVEGWRVFIQTVVSNREPWESIRRRLGLPPR